MMLLPGWIFSQNAPVTRLPDTLACPGSTITIPVKVTGFNQIGSVSLRLLYDADKLTYLSWSNSSGFPGLYAFNPSAGTVNIGGFTFTPGGITLADHSVFFTITFSYSGGVAGLTWSDNGSSCEYAGPASSFPVLNDLPYENYYINGSIGPSLTAGFSANNLLPLLGETVVFSDLSTGNPTGWSWNFSPSNVTYVNGTHSNSQHPQVVFSYNGPYSVSLVVSVGPCEQTMVRADYIHAGTPGLWTGAFSTAWNDPGNWHNYLVPDAFTPVTIPSAALFWPEYSGDFTLGAQCLDLTIEGATGQMTVNGDFIIP